MVALHTSSIWLLELLLVLQGGVRVEESVFVPIGSVKLPGANCSSSSSSSV